MSTFHVRSLSQLFNSANTDSMNADLTVEDLADKIMLIQIYRIRQIAIPMEAIIEAIFIENQ
jgi:hypothetical protein